MRSFLVVLVSGFFLAVASFSPVRADHVVNVAPGHTFQQAVDSVRDMRAKDPSLANQTIYLNMAPGEYFFDAPVLLTPADSRLTVQAEGGNVVFTRGKKITGWTKNDKGWFVTRIPEVAEGKWWFDQLYVNHKRAVRAKTPNEFYYYIGGQATSVVDPKTGKEISAPSRAFYPRTEQVSLFKTIVARASEKNPLNDVQIRFFHSWASSKHRLEAYDSKANTVLLTGGARWNLAYWGDGKLRYEIEGIPEALDAPGEFLLSRDGTLQYIPLPGETLEDLRAIAPDGPKKFDESGFIRIEGNMGEIAKAGEALPDDSPLFARDIRFVGIRFTCDPFTLPDEGLSSGQAATNMPSSVYVDGGRNIELVNCKVSHAAGWAIWFHRACKNCKVQCCLLDDLAGGGVRIGTHLGGSDIADSMTTSDVSVLDTIVHAYGRIEASAIGVWIGAASNNKILHNDISDGFYTGISVGWVWGYRPSKAFGNKIEFNHIHNIGHGVLSDMGGVYSLGISPGTTVSNNVIHHIYSYNRYGRGGWGLYTDEGSSDMTFENNLVHHVHTGTIHQHYGKNNLFRNNILALSLEGQIIRSRNEDHLSFTIANNIVVWDRGDALVRSFVKNEGRFALEKNLYWFMGTPTTDEEKAGRFFVGKTFAEWQAEGNDRGSIMADPGFVDPENGDFHFKSGKPNDAVKAIGFKPFNYSLAGLTRKGMSVWGDPAKLFVMPEVKLAPDAPPAPPLKVRDTFETPRSEPLLNARTTKTTPQVWKLKVSTLDDARKPGKVLFQSEAMRYAQQDWTEFQWLGFCAIGKETATIDLDNIRIAGAPLGSPKAAQFTVTEDFDALAKIPPKGVSMDNGGKSDAFQLLADGANKYLRFNDGPQYREAFNPHCYYRFAPLTGTVRVAFDARVSEKALLHIEAREYNKGKANAYTAGPSLFVAGGALRDRSMELCKLEPDRWMRFELEFVSGDARVPVAAQVLTENGNRFLRLNDGSQYALGFQPSFDLSPNYSTGYAFTSFKMRLSKDAALALDGRDHATPFRNGYSFRCSGGKINAGGRVCGDYETDRWYKVTMRVPLGTASNRTWQMTVVDCATEKTIVDAKDLALNKTWSELQWVVFYTPDNKRSTVDLDDLVLENVE